MDSTPFVYVATAVLTVFSFLAITIWAGNRRRERQAFYRTELLKKIAEMPGENAAAVLANMQDQAHAKQREMREGLKIGGLASMAVGLAMMIFLGVVNHDITGVVNPGGLVPFMVGGAFLLYCYVLAPKDQ